MAKEGCCIMALLLINASNIGGGGCVQVTDSIVCSLNKFEEHRFVVVLSSVLKKTLERVKDYNNIVVFQYDLPKDLNNMMLGKDKFLDKLVEEHRVDAVLTVFGPSYWIPRRPHLVGFARAQCVLPNSPFYKIIKLKDFLYYRFWCILILYYFGKCSRYLYTENPFITRLLKKKLPSSEIFTVTNYYNQIFDNPDKWNECKLPKFEGITLLTVSINYPHKNLSISIEIAKIFRTKYPDFNFRFVFAGCNASEFNIPPELEKNFLFLGRVDVSQCPSLYKQSDVMFMPTLLESFTATYPEAMVMGVPIVTTDLDFARGLCGSAAYYYSPLDAQDAVSKIFEVVTTPTIREELIKNGKKQLSVYDNYEQRTQKLIKILTHI